MEKHCTDSLTKKPVFHNIADLYLTTSLNFKWEKKIHRSGAGDSREAEKKNTID